ncbi:hypothetical protein [Paractinoplanes hotanensis]|uniref:Uncharacterized protein n=1 Tax=Paractinoplanes hotanensis TaxID=2906497 RepID=A0ABT0Y3S3_9ACTN|nr:hypothetical protein [Actinoplanes hotanensis]MCM4080637.1 hypothetical protein [Actinoplanes hotanensis]
MTVDAAARVGWGRGGLVCGAVTVGALALVFGQLGEYQVMDYADQDASIGLAGAFLGSIGAAGVIAVIRMLPRGKRWARGHVVVPLVLLPVAVVPLVVGLERNNVEAVVIWGSAALATHVLLETARRGAVDGPARGGGDVGLPGESREVAWWGLVFKGRVTEGIALVLVVAGLLTWACQHRWRAQKFEAVGLPLYVAVVPGYSVSGTWAGRYTVSMLLKPDDRDTVHFVDAVIRANPRCRNGNTDRWIIERETGPSALGICLSGGDSAAMTVAPGYQAPDLTPLFERITVRKVDGAVLADHRNGGEMEPD